ncbi:Tip41 protein [Maudiozyma humilis]|uniref:Tip41 protein n=1 Tax=Maudiozyma humilis TaxID=51915 RepID=A0AAV5S543_MAUHU|nr:Tip41 protein [Kazachstania humilis]
MSEQQEKQNAFRPGGINTIHIDAARKMHASTVRARVPTRAAPSASATAAGAASTARFMMPSPRTASTSSPGKAGHPRHKCNNPNNPACAGCGGVIIPSPQAFMPLEDKPSMTLGSWTVSSQKRPILNAGELETWEKEHLGGLGALPEMIFGNNYVQILDEERGWGLEFNALDALKLVKLEDSGIRVAHSQDWMASKLKAQQEQHGSAADGDVDMSAALEIVKNYDWTYTTNYEGTAIGPRAGEYEWRVDNSVKLPVGLLSRPDPILYFDDMILFEDELADCGISMLNVKIRVMEERLLLLSRFFLRVDNVLIRVQDTRVYVEFADNRVVREVKRYEGAYDAVIAQHRMSHSHDPKAALRDSNWVAEHTPVIERRCEVLTKCEGNK